MEGAAEGWSGIEGVTMFLSLFLYNVGVWFGNLMHFLILKVQRTV